MLARKNSVAMLAAYMDACGFWRLYMPSFSLPGSSFWCFPSTPQFALTADKDIIVVQRCCTQPQLDFIRICSEIGQKVIIDLDDDFWNVPNSNPMHAILTKMREGFNNCIRMADAVTVSTLPLAKVVRRNVKQMINLRTKRDIPIVIAQNKIDQRLFAKPIATNPDKIIVGWAGSTSHQNIPGQPGTGDLGLIEHAIGQLAPTNPDVTFQFRGGDVPESLRGINNVQHKLWMPVSEYGHRMPLWQWNIALAPVIQHPFNDSKSAVKMIEAGYCGIPCLASSVNPYEYFVSHDPELRWLICPSASSWEPKIRELIHDRGHREYLGQRMRDVVDRHFSVRGEHDGWSEALEVVS